MSLLDKAKKIPLYRKTRRGKSREEIELCLAWLKSEVAYSQLGKVLNTVGSSLYGIVAIGLRQAYREGKIKIV